ncbi:MAG: hypothetical protein LBN10_02985 [Propionibacteriaceae bacterium]|jgi:hypothetical protein|nr:hypothetical protein [Propionibacteriaceae bacterium]
MIIPLEGELSLDLGSSITAMAQSMLSMVSDNLPIVLGVAGIFLGVSVVLGFVFRLPKKAAK